MIYLYAIIDRPDAPLPDIRGLEDASIFMLPCRDIAAVVSLSTTAEASPTEASVWQHETVLEALMADRTALPVRFGTVLADESAVQAALTSHYDEFTADLKRVRGHVELGLRILWDDNARMGCDALQMGPDFKSGPNETPGPHPETPDPHPEPVEGWPLTRILSLSKDGSGRAYMLTRLDEERKLRTRRQQAESLAEDIHIPLARLSAESTRRTLITARSLLTASYLVERERVEDFRQEVGNLSSAHPELHLLCTGPWPPFSFVAMSDEQ